MDKLMPQEEETIASKIYIIRGQRIMLDTDLAALYGVETKVLKQQVRRNAERFPEDFMFELTKEEFDGLRSQIVTSKRGGTRYLPMAFTEQGVAMLSGILNSSKAVYVNIKIMRVFVRMRQLIATSNELLKRIEKLEESENEQNRQITRIYQIIKQMIEPVYKNRKPIGFRQNKKE